MHPLSPNLTEYSDAELQKKQSDLVARLNYAYKFGNVNMVRQIQMMLEDYQLEIAARHRKTLEELANKNDKFSGIIDIK